MVGKWVVEYWGAATQHQWMVWSGPHDTEQEAHEYAAKGMDISPLSQWRIVQVRWEYPDLSGSEEPEQD